MPSRYYFLSSMPMLRFTDKAPLTWDSFMDQAKGNVSVADYRALGSIADGQYCSNAFLSDWKDLNDRLDDAVNTQRRHNLGRTTDGAVVFRDYEIEQAASAALNAKNPLEAELSLMRFRYGWLEKEKGYEPFSEKALLVYALQLRILLRKDLFTLEAGNAEYRRMFGILQNELSDLKTE